MKTEEQKIKEQLQNRLERLLLNLSEHFKESIHLTLPFRYLEKDGKSGFRINYDRYEELAGKKCYTSFDDKIFHCNVGIGHMLFGENKNVLDIQASTAGYAHIVAICKTLKDMPPIAIEKIISSLREAVTYLAEFTSQEIIDTIEIFVSEKANRRAILSRPEIVDRWPWPIEHTAGAAINALLDSTNPNREPLPIESNDALLLWFREVAPVELAKWAKAGMNKVKAGFGDDFEKGAATEHPGTLLWALGRDSQKRLTAWPVGGLALLYKAEMAVMEGQRKPRFAVPAGKQHHSLLEGWRDTPKQPNQKMKPKLIEGRIELLAPGRPVQLILPIEEGFDTITESFTRTIAKWKDPLKQWRGTMGLRHWAALLRLFHIEGGRKGFVRWTVDGHLEALGISKKKRTEQETRDSTATFVELLTKMVLRAYSKDGHLWHERNVLIVGGRFGRVEGSRHLLEGIEIQANPLLYDGVLDMDTGKLGSNWYPSPPELAHIDQQRFQYAIALGLILPIRWRWAWLEGKDYVALAGKNLLNAAGIEFKRNEPGKVWETLERNLAELAKRDGLGRWTWDEGRPSLDGICRLWPAPWQLDSTIHGIAPLELPPGPTILTGAELKEWRKGKAWTQAEAAKALEVSQNTISVAETKGKEAISNSLAEKLKAFKARREPPT